MLRSALPAALLLALAACADAPDAFGPGAGKSDDPGGAGPDSCGISCDVAADCPQSEPYCDVDAATCRQTPPECVSSADCSEHTPFCHTSGYCAPVPQLNCAPGWVEFEGQCDNPACIEELCPEGTALIEDTCECAPLSPPPACVVNADCTPAHPYCDRDTGVCEKSPPECVSSADCDDHLPFCHSDGYCAPFPQLNCAPGWVVFEGECDNPACVPELCPAGTFLDADTCDCRPTCQAAPGAR